MSRVKRGVTSRARHNRLLKRVEGYRMTNNRLIQRAREADLHAGQYAYHGRKLRKRDMRSLWIARISGALRLEGLKYSTFMAALKKKEITLDRKMLSTMIIEDPKSFTQIMGMVK
ncbi:MAG: 50S ribosomal protein L20 [bacterium]|nr:50S ribosomal protein L20 [bacterium]